MPPDNRGLAPTVPVYLVRHGVTVWNRDGLVQGWTDIPLSPLGRAQAARLADALSGVPFARVITSTLGRAIETAEAIAARHPGLPVETFADLREYNCGTWEGRPFVEVRSTERDGYLAWYNDPQVPMPGGESMAGASRRAVPVMAGALGGLPPGDKQPLLIVAHGGINRLIAAHLMGMELEVAKRLRLDNASISIFEPFAGAYALRLWNSVAHLDGLSDAGEGVIASQLG